jgi:hypothetical protein
MNNVTINDLIAQATELITKAYDEGFKRGAEAEKSVYKRKAPKSQQDIRDEIIEKAKRDVAELEVWMLQGNYRNFKTKSKYFVNSISKVVVALVSIDASKQFLNNGLLGKGIAKCDPSDCFNVHIGKAIALRRALGLEVPAEYLNAPQPTEVRVGDKILYVGFDPKFDGEVETVSGFNYGGHILTKESPGCIEKDELSGVSIIDDSRD